MATIDVTLGAVESGWRATIGALEGIEPATAEAATPEDALDDARWLAFVACDRALRAAGVDITAATLVTLELHLRHATSQALAAATAEPMTYVVVRPWGNDVSTFPDLDGSFQLLDGREIVAQAVARRLTTPRGSHQDDPLYGFDCRALLHASGSPAEQAAWRQQIERQAVADERVQAAEVSLRKADGWQIGVRLVLADGSQPFRLVLAVTGVSAQLLLEDD